MRPLPLVACGLAVSVSAAASLAIGPRVIVSGVQASDTSILPGSMTDPVERFPRDFNNFYRSPDGMRWIVTMERKSSAETFILAVLTGNGLGFTTPVYVTAGQITQWSSPGDEDSLNSLGVVYGINNAGDWAMGARQPNSSRIVKNVGGVWSFPVVGGTAVPGVTPTVNWGTAFDVYGLSADGSSIYYSGTDTSATTDDYLFLGSTMAVRTNTTVPTAQLTSPTNRPWENFGASGFCAVDSMGTNWIGVGDVTTTTNDDIVAVNNAVIAEQGATYLTQGAVGNGRLAVPMMSSNGAHWTFRGTTGTTPHYIAKDNTIYALTGNPIFPGSTESWGTPTGYARTFTGASVNNAGDIVVIGGATGGPAARGVAVYNNSRVIIADGDPIDLDSNGLYDDNVFVLGLATADLYNNFIDETGHWYGVIAVRDGAGVDLGEAIVRVRINPFCTADFNQSEGVDADDLFAFLDAWFAQNGTSGMGLSADIDLSGNVDADDLFAFLDLWFAQNGSCF